MHFCELLRHQYTADDFILHDILWTGDMCFTYDSVFNFCDSPSGYLSSLRKRGYQVRSAPPLGWYLIGHCCGLLSATLQDECLIIS